MEPVKTQYTATWIEHIADVPQEEWDALAMPLKTPFFEWEWLHNMETSQSVGTKGRTGWQPLHLVLRQGSTLVAAAPLYVKGHSQGEFVFDHQWAEVADRMGINYYPKLLGMSPFTPAQGYRFLIAPGEDEEVITEMMVSAIDHLCIRSKISSCHFLYADPDWQEVMMRNGFSRWLHHSFIWQNQGFTTFDDYLGAFNANQRRNIKRERKAVANAGLTFQVHTGEDISKALCGRMYEFYADTCDKFGWWGSKYLTRRFFEQLYPNYSDRTVLFAAYSEDDPKHPVGMSICFTKGDLLYGRYWGSTQDIECLHFDACYYTPIEWAIAHNIQSFDPGAGGRHKKRRGFPATPNHSLHRFYEPRLAQLFDYHIEEINAMEQQQMDAINQDLPFKAVD